MPDAIATSGMGAGHHRCEVQMAVDAEHHLIVTHEVTNIGSNQARLTAMGQKALKAAKPEASFAMLADRGYRNGDEALACEGTGILPCIPRTQTWAPQRAASSPWRTSSTTRKRTAAACGMATT